MKKIICMFLSIMLLINTSMPALATETVEEVGMSQELDYECLSENSWRINEFVYEEEVNADGYHVLSCYKDGVLWDRVIMKLGEDEYVYESFADSSSDKIADPVRQTRYFSDYIIVNSFVNAPMAVSYSPKTGSLGEVKYKALNDSGTGYVTRTLDFTSVLKDSSKGNFDVILPAGATITEAIAIFAAGFGVANTVIKSVTIALVTGMVGLINNKLKKALTTEISGTLYCYNVTAEPVPSSSAGNKSYTAAGTVYAGTVKESGRYNNKIIYEDMYPDFISRKDTYVAQTFYREFWSSSASVQW